MENKIIDGININAEHFSRMTESECVRRMIADGFVPGATKELQTEWAKNAYKFIKGIPYKPEIKK